MRKVIKKICLLGEECVGKTSITRRYVHNSFSEDYKSTIGVSLCQKSIKTEYLNMSLMIWDLEGDREPEDFPTDYIQGAHGSLIVADITRPITFVKAFKFAKLFLSINRDATCVLALNKMDLLSETDVVNVIEELKENDKFNANVFSAIVPSSAKNDANIERIFRKIVGEPND